MYYVSDLEKSVPFYRDVLGLKQAWRDDDKQMVGFKLGRGSGEIVIQSDKSLPKFDYSFLVDNVEAFCNKVTDSGFKVAVKPFEVRCGKYAVLADPDGNKIPIIDLTKFGGVPRND